MSREAAEVALGALESELARAERALEAATRNYQTCSERVLRIRQAIGDVRFVLDPPRLAVVAKGLIAEAPGVLRDKAVDPGRTARYLILRALRVHDRVEGLGPLAVSALVGIDKNHVHQELCHLTKAGSVVRVGTALYRIDPSLEVPNA